MTVVAPPASIGASVLEQHPTNGRSARLSPAARPLPQQEGRAQQQPRAPRRSSAVAAPHPFRRPQAPAAPATYSTPHQGDDDDPHQHSLAMDLALSLASGEPCRCGGGSSSTGMMMMMNDGSSSSGDERPSRRRLRELRGGHPGGSRGGGTTSSWQYKLSTAVSSTTRRNPRKQSEPHVGLGATAPRGALSDRAAAGPAAHPGAPRFQFVAGLGVPLGAAGTDRGPASGRGHCPGRARSAGQQRHDEYGRKQPVTATGCRRGGDSHVPNRYDDDDDDSRSKQVQLMLCTFRFV